MNQRRVVDLPGLERSIFIAPVELREREPADFAQPHHREKVPDYVTPTDGVSPIGVLSAAAVVRMYEEAAQAIEAMGEEQKRVVERCEQVMAEAHAAMEDAKGAAEALRRRGAAHFAMVESWALHTAEVRKTCEALQQKTVADLVAVT